MCAIALIVASCSQFEERTIAEERANKPTYNVSFSEINRIDFSRIVSPQTKAGNVLSKVITPIVEGQDTLMYVINYGEKEGWVLASADRRTPQIIAMSEKGQFDENAINENLRAWIDATKEKIVQLKQAPDSIPDSTFLADNEEENLISTKGGNEHEYDWLQLVYTIIDVVAYEDVDHLMETSWGQESPWNMAIPLAYNNNRCPAGCGATALAQVLYYYHYYSGKPQMSRLSASCNYYYDDTLATPTWGDYSSLAWNGMSRYANEKGSAGNNLVGALIADVAWGVDMIFNPNGSGTSLANCRDYLQSLSFNCSASDFDDATVVINIGFDRPVIVGLDSTTGGQSHIAVIDGVRVYRYCYTRYYQWMPIGTFPPVEPEYPDLDHPELYEISVSWGEVSHYGYRVNWGYDGNYDDMLYSSIGYWSANNNTYSRAPILYNIY